MTRLFVLLLLERQVNQASQIEMKSSLHSKFPNEVNPKDALVFFPLIFLPLGGESCWGDTGK
jgi:hypothetical protein